jgi:hypothetical protein
MIQAVGNLADLSTNRRSERIYATRLFSLEGISQGEKKQRRSLDEERYAGFNQSADLSLIPERLLSELPEPRRNAYT